MEIGRLQEALLSNTKFKVCVVSCFIIACKSHCNNDTDHTIVLQSVGVLLESNIIPIGNSNVWPGKHI